MSDTPEPLAAILAEMRHRADNHRLDGWESVAEELEEFCDRIDAAAAREHLRDATKKAGNAAEDIVEQVKAEASFGHFAPVVVEERRHGNASAMRAALESVEGNIAEDEPGRFWLQDPEAILHEVQAALAAPARNCDRPECATAEGAIAALRANPCADHDFCKEQTDCAECAARWLVAPAEGGAE